MASGSSVETRQIVMMGVLLVGVCCVIYMWYIGPSRVELARSEKRLEKLRQEVEVAESFQNRLPELRKQILQQRDELATLRKVLPTTKETAEIVRRIEHLAVRSSLHLRSFTPQKTVQNDFYEDWPILMTISGTYDNLGLFFEKIGAFDRVINVDNLSIRPVKGDSRSRTIAATCRATTFVFKEISDE